MKKILKAITFLSLVMCFMLNTNFVYAAKDPRCPRNDAPTEDVIDSYVYDNGQGALIYTMLLPHDKVAKYAKVQDANDLDFRKNVITAAKGLEKIIKGSSGDSLLKIMFGSSRGVADSIADIVSKSALSNAQSWELMSRGSKYCGVKVYYWQSKFFGGALKYYRAEGF